MAVPSHRLNENRHDVAEFDEINSTDPFSCLKYSHRTRTVQ
jgi:hypothetical protein